MTLPYRQERLARRVDHALRQSDPHLASMLSVFTRLAAADAMPAWEQLPPRRARAWRALRWPASAAVFLVSAAGLLPRQEHAEAYHPWKDAES